MGLQQESRSPRAGQGRTQAREDLQPQHGPLAPHTAFHPLGFHFLRSKRLVVTPQLLPQEGRGGRHTARSPLLEGTCPHGPRSQATVCLVMQTLDFLLQGHRAGCAAQNGPGSSPPSSPFLSAHPGHGGSPPASRSGAPEPVLPRQADARSLGPLPTTA